MSKARTVLPWILSLFPALSAAPAFAADASPWSVAGQVGLGVTRTDNALETPSGARPDVWLFPEIALALKYKATPTLSLSAGIDESVQLYGRFPDAGFTKPFPYIAASRDFGTWNLTGKIAQEFAYDQRFDASPVKRFTASAILSHDFVLSPASRVSFQARIKRAWSDFGSPMLDGYTLYKTSLGPSFDAGKWSYGVTGTIAYQAYDAGAPSARDVLGDMDFNVSYQATKALSFAVDLDLTKTKSNVVSHRYTETTFGPSVTYKF